MTYNFQHIGNNTGSGLNDIGGWYQYQKQPLPVNTNTGPLYKNDKMIKVILQDNDHSITYGSKIYRLTNLIRKNKTNE
jgi:hypothetical protein